MRHALLATAFFLASCTGGPQPADDTGPVEPPQGVAGEAGNLLLIHWQDAADFDGSTVLAGMFVDDLQGVYNPIECLFQFNYCFADFPSTPGDVVALDPAVRFRLDDASYRYNGDAVSLGPAQAEYVDDVQAGAEYYYGALESEVFQPGSSVGAALDGEWGAWQSAAALTLPSEIQLLEPDPLSPLLLREGEDLPLAWQPGEGTVLLLVASSSGAWLHNLHDDGEHVLGWSELGALPGEELIVVLGRWSFADVDVNGNALRIQAGDEQWLSARVSHLDLSEHLPFQPVDRCDDTADVLEPGTYWGSFDGYGADLDPTDAGCTGWEAAGAEGLARVRLQPGEVATAHYELLTGDGSVYVLTDCDDASTCVAGTDAAAGGAETVRWINDTGSVADYWLVLDVFDHARGGTFALDLQIEPSVPAPLVADCAQVAGAEPLTTGVWTGSLLGASDDLDLDDAACVPGTGENAVDQLARIEVAPSERVEITMITASDAGLVLLSDCSDVDSCLAADASTVGSAVVSWVNLGDAAQSLTLAIDGREELYELQVLFESVDLAAEVDACADASSLPVLGEGTWYGDSAGLGDDLDLDPTGCTGHGSAGPDGLVRVEVPAGRRLRASIDMPGADPVLYLLTDCDDADSCVVGADHNVHGRETLVYDNLSVADEVLFLGIDSFEHGGAYALDLQSTPIQQLQPADSCGDVAGGVVLQTGIYVGDLTGYGNDLTPSDCTGFVADGGEGFARLVIPPGHTAELALSMTGGDASLYLVEDCTDPDSCVVGADFGFNPDGHFEVVSIDNPASVDRELVVVLDAYQATGPYELHVRIE